MIAFSETYILGNLIKQLLVSKAIRQKLGWKTFFFLKNKVDENRELFFKQRNLCVSLSRKSKTDYFSKINQKQITDKKQFW